MKQDKVFAVHSADTEFKAALDALVDGEYILVASYGDAFVANKIT
jgi:hypothetical protein